MWLCRALRSSRAPTIACPGNTNTDGGARECGAGESDGRVYGAWNVLGRFYRAGMRLESVDNSR